MAIGALYPFEQVAMVQEAKRREQMSALSASGMWQGGSLLGKLRNLSASMALTGSGAGVEELVELSAYARLLYREFEQHGVPAPKWLGDAQQILGLRIKAAYREEQEAKLRRIEKEIEDLRSKEERKLAKEGEAAELRRALGLDGGSERK